MGLLMNAIDSAIVLTSVILLLAILLARSSRDTNSAADAEDGHLPSEDENRQWTQPFESAPKREEQVTSFLPNTADQSRCPACGATITANDEKCPSCEIAFVADGSRRWTLRNVGPADGIYLPPTEFSKQPPSDLNTADNG